MDIFDISSTSLQDMLLIQAIAQTGSVSQAAAIVRVTQPTASYRLGRLRDMFGDPLFVRINRSMLATPVGLRVIQAFEKQIDGFTKLIEPNNFDPLSTKREFSILSKGLFRPQTLISLSDLFFKSTHKAKLLFEPLKTDLTINQQLHERGDAYIWTFDAAGAPGIRRQVSPELKVLMHFDPEFCDPPTTIDAFYNSRSIMLGTEHFTPGAVDKELTKLGYKMREPDCLAPTVDAISHLIVGTNLIYCGSSLFSEGIPSKLVSAELPLKVPGLRHELRWSISKEHDEGHAWFINLVARATRASISRLSQVDPDEGFVVLSEYETLKG